MVAFFCPHCFRRRKKCFQLGVLVLVTVVVICIVTTLRYGDLNQVLSEGCDAKLPSDFISKLCRLYKDRVAHGNLCQPLCGSIDLTITRCIHHGDTIVIFAKWNGKKVVLKWKKPHQQQAFSVGYLKDTFFVPENSNTNLHQVWKQLLLGQFESVLGSAIYKLSVNQTDNVLRSIGAAFTTDPNALSSILPLIGQDEFAMLGFFQDSMHFPKIHGYCGQTYAIERLTPYSDYYPSLMQKLDWETRIKLALSFLNLITELETTKIGRLHHCDIQEGNFGVTDDFRVKLIDVDLILTDDRAKEVLAQPNCTKDSDCDFFDCVSMCDVRHHKCLARKITNNFQVICRDIFKSRWPGFGLLGKIPSKIRSILTTLLNDCSSKRFGYLPTKHHRIKSTLRSLKLVLTKELKMIQTKSMINKYKKSNK